MRWPWLKRERRSFTSAFVDALLRRADGRVTDVAGTSAAELAAGLWGRAFAAATVEPATRATAAVTPSVLAAIGRGLILRGEAVFEARVRGGRVMLDQASQWRLYGGQSDPMGWQYDLTLNGPSGAQRTRLVRGERVVHVRYAVDPVEPWRGVSPLHGPSSSAALAANVEGKLAQETLADTGQLLPVPGGRDVTRLSTDIAALQGRTMLVETTAGAWSGNPADAPRSDWTSQRLGADPPAALVELRRHVLEAVIGACGIPRALVGRSDGTAMREGWRQFLFGAVAPAGALVEEELRLKLDSPGLRLTWPELRASDLQGRARAFGTLVQAGMDARQAAELAGFEA